MAGTLGLDEAKLKRDSLLKELRLLGNDLSVPGPADSVDADVERL